MATSPSRRQFLADVGRGVLVASVGGGLAAELGFSPRDAFAAEPAGAGPALSFGSLDPLVALMQETPVDRFLPVMAQKIKAGTELRQLVAAAAFANARTFGGEDYVGYHTMMALAPALHMSRELSGPSSALPVLKVLYRNTSRIAQVGGRSAEVLRPVQPLEAKAPDCCFDGESLRDAVRAKDMERAERMFAALAAGGASGAEDAFNDLLYAVHDHTEVHRVVLPYRAWDLLDLIGREHAHALLRQSVRYCVKAESWGNGQGTYDKPKVLLPKVLEEHKLLGRDPGTRAAEDKWVEDLAKVFFTASAEQAASAAAAALAEGFAPASVGEAISLAANQLVLRDHGRTPVSESPGKPLGSVHGDSIGVHACDSANAWRNMARAANARNSFACLVLGAYQVAVDRVERGGDFQNWQPLPLPQHVNQVKSTGPEELLRDLDEAVRGNLQARAAAVVQRYGDLGHDPRGAFDLLLRYAVSEDGSLHAEKFYRTACEEFAATRPAFRWRQLVALARVTASEFGRPAPGVAEAKELLS
jgi:hypothetical protein